MQSDQKLKKERWKKERERKKKRERERKKKGERDFKYLLTLILTGGS